MKKDVIIKQMYKFTKIFKIDSSFLFYLKKLYNKPSTLMIHANYECNFNCSYCYLKEKKGYCLSFSKLKDLIKQGKKLGIYSVDILGGEPLMYKYLLELIDFILEQKMLVNIFTNGALINESFLNKLKEYQKEIIFVIKSDSKECYKKQNNSCILFKELIDRIRLTKKFGFKVLTFIVVTKKNYLYVKEILNYCDKEGILPVFERFAPVKDEKLNKQLMIDSNMWDHILNEVRSFWEKKEVIDFIDFYAKLNGGVCSCLSNNIAVMQDGIVKPCPEAHDNLVYGDFKKKSLKQIWKNSQKLRNKFMKIPLACKSCSNSRSCRGGCKIYTYQTKGSLNEKDPLCNGEIITTYPHCAFSLLKANILKK